EAVIVSPDAGGAKRYVQFLVCLADYLLLRTPFLSWGRRRQVGDISKATADISVITEQHR
ncbi:UNVERIFIED_CONTAM: hypothetical protein NY603_32645, partial [Bacteroidetes bacterium 56_B9]